MGRIKVSLSIDFDRNKEIRRANREREVEAMRHGQMPPRPTTIEPRKGGKYNRRRDNVIPLRRRDQ